MGEAIVALIPVDSLSARDRSDAYSAVTDDHGVEPDPLEARVLERWIPPMCVQDDFDGRCYGSLRLKGDVGFTQSIEKGNRCM